MQKWDFTYVDDIAEAYVKLLNTSRSSKAHEIFNIGTGNAVSVREVVSLIKEMMGITYEPEWGSIPHRKNEVWFICADISKAMTFLLWQPQKKLREGIEPTVNWYKNRLGSRCP
jgi:nucleoside-diphosphate-sugar epimerase